MRGIPSVDNISVKLLFNPRSNEDVVNELCNDFDTFSTDVVMQDVQSMHRLGSLQKVTAGKHVLTACTGFTADCVRAHVSPEYPRF